MLKISKEHVGQHAIVFEHYNGYRLVTIKTVGEYRIGIGNRKSFAKRDVQYIHPSFDTARVVYAKLVTIHSAHGLALIDLRTKYARDIAEVLKGAPK